MEGIVTSSCHVGSSLFWQDDEKLRVSSFKSKLSDIVWKNRVTWAVLRRPGAPVYCRVCLVDSVFIESVFSGVNY